MELVNPLRESKNGSPAQLELEQVEKQLAAANDFIRRVTAHKATL